jgi:hypothetical protein
VRMDATNRAALLWPRTTADGWLTARSAMVCDRSTSSTSRSALSVQLPP